MKNFSRLPMMAAGMILLLLSFSALHAQSIRGAVTGTVTDNSGAVIPNAQVVLTAPATGVSVSTTTNRAGVYRFEAVLVGDYTVTVAVPGFVKATVPATVTVGALVGRDLVLHAGESSAVIVTTSVPDLQTEDAVRSAVISSEALAELPISGQNSLNLMLLAPGVSASKTGSNADGGIGAINGARPRSNNFLLDGISNNDISVMGPQFTFYNNDALQEVSFQTSNFSAEYGRAGGGVIIQVTKSGTNQLHGTIVDVFSTHLFRASTQTQRNTWFNAGKKGNLIPKFVEHIPAFTIGGPVYIPHLYDGRDKTFFFGAGQWDRYSASGTQSSFTVPTAAGYATLSALASSCPNVANYLAQLGSARGSDAIGSSLIPIDVQASLASTTCNGTARTGQTVQVGTYVRTAPELYKDNNHLVRIDHIVSQKQSLMFRWLWDSNSDPVSGSIGVNSQFDVPFAAKYMSGNFNHTYSITPRLVNEFRFGFARNKYGWYIGNGISSTAPYVTVSGLSNLTLSTTWPQGRVSNNWQYEDTVTWLKGRHAVKVGTEFLRQLAVQDAPYNSRGTVTYASNTANTIITNPITSLANYIDNFGGSGGTAAISFGTGHYRPNLLSVAFFAQDTFKVHPDLTVTYGLRYENFGQPANIFKYPVYAGPDASLTNPERVNQDNNNFGPTIGFSYSPSWVSNHTFVLRGGYQVTYDTFFNNMLSNMTSGSPNTQTSQAITSTSTTSTPRGYVGLSSVLATLTPVALNPYTSFASQYKKDMRNPYYHHFSLGIQQQMPGKVVLDLAYVGSLGRQLFFSNNVNPILPNSTYTGYAQQSTPYGTAYTRLYSNRGSITTRESGLTSSYHSLQLQVHRRAFSTPLGKVSFNSSYTWSKNMDNLTDIFATYSSGAYFSKSITQYGPAKNFDHGPSDTDRRHVSSTYIQWQIRGTGNHRLIDYAVGGWSVSPVLLVQSGAPYTIFNGTDRDLDGASSNDRPNIGNPRAPINTRAVITSTTNCTSGYYNPNLSGSGISAKCVNPGDVRWVQAPTYQPFSSTMASRNSVYASRYLSLDLNVLKKVTLKGRVKGELRGEFFNITNNQNFDEGTAASTVSSTSNTFLDYSLVSGGSRSFRVGGKILF